MKKQFFLLIMAFSLTVFVGCDFDDEITPPNYVTFGETSYNMEVLEGSSSSVEVTVYTGNITGSDRTFDLNVSPSSTLSSSAYNLPATVTVPANTNEVTFTVDVSDTDLDNDGDTLILTLGEESGLTAGPATTINIERVCPFDIDNFVGTYDASEVFTAGSNLGYSFGAANGLDLQVELSPNTEDETGNSLVLNNSEDFFDFIPDGTILTFDPADGSLSLPSGLMVFGYPLTVSSSNVNTCAQQLRFTGALANFGTYRVTLDKQ